MFDFYLLMTGVIMSLVLAILKIFALLTIGWLWVAVPVGVALAIIIIRHVPDVLELLFD